MRVELIVYGLSVDMLPWSDLHALNRYPTALTACKVTVSLSSMVSVRSSPADMEYVVVAPECTTVIVIAHPV